MNLQTQVDINRQILQLLVKKYGGFVSCWPNNYEVRYYKHLLQDTRQACEALKHGGLAVPS